MSDKTEERLNGILSKVTDAISPSDGPIYLGDPLTITSRFEFGGIPSNSFLEINGGSVRLCFRNKKPNWWFRVWYRLLLGWRWFDK